MKTDNSKNSNESKNDEKKPLIAQVASSIGEFNYQLDINPIVMSKAPDPLASFDDNELQAQDEFFKEQEKKRRETRYQMSLLSGLDMSREMREKIDDDKRRHEKTTLIQAMLAGRDPNEFVKQVNRKADQQHASHEHQRVKKQLQTDVQQQVAGVDSNIRQEARDDQVSNAIDQSVKSGMINGKDVVGAKETDSKTDIIDSTSVQDKMVDTGRQEKIVVGQDDQTLSNTDNAEYDPLDLLQNIQANFEVTNAEQMVINSQPMINLDLRLGAIPSKIRDRNGFVVDLSKKDIAKIKAELSKRLHKKFKQPVSIKTFNNLVAGNCRQSYSKTELSNTILKGYHVDFSKVINEESPLKFKSSVLVDKKKEIKPDLKKITTPVDDRLQRNQQQQILLREKMEAQLNQQADANNQDDHSKEHMFHNTKYSSKNDDGPELLD